MPCVRFFCDSKEQGALLKERFSLVLLKKKLINAITSHWIATNQNIFPPYRNCKRFKKKGMFINTTWRQSLYLWRVRTNTLKKCLWLHNMRLFYCILTRIITPMIISKSNKRCLFYPLFGYSNIFHQVQMYDVLFRVICIYIFGFSLSLCINSFSILFKANQRKNHNCSLDNIIHFIVWLFVVVYFYCGIKKARCVFCNFLTSWDLSLWTAWESEKTYELNRTAPDDNNRNSGLLKGTHWIVSIYELEDHWIELRITYDLFNLSRLRLRKW